jgi:kinesin family protein 5
MSEKEKIEEDGNENDSGNVKVVCRFRPINNSEQERFGKDLICEFSENKHSVTVKSNRDVGASYVDTNMFTFDRVFDMRVSQREVYEKAAKPIIEGVLKGFNGTVFAYGQTGSGKTHTMQGPDIEDLEMQGIVPRMVRTVFNRIENLSENIEFTVKVSMAEIYMEHVKDLLDPSKVNLQIKENRQKGVYIQDITERYIGSELDVYEIMKLGNNHRTVASTAMNETSSRSHSIFMMNISQNNLDDFSSKSGTLYLVDLAGSEKVAKTNVSGTQLDEAKGINKSLSALGKVIHALTDKKSTHIPYRESKLTRILTESLGGNAKT